FSLQSLAQNIYLVSVGIADYPGTENDLTLPAKDAETIQWIYQKNHKAETILLTDAQATRSNVLSSMTRIFNKASAKDIIVLFFSGHG
ncbi:caspase family protein, partial [Bacteroides thetaiotaomicron]